MPREPLDCAVIHVRAVEKRGYARLTEFMRTLGYRFQPCAQFAQFPAGGIVTEPVVVGGIIALENPFVAIAMCFIEIRYFPQDVLRPRCQGDIPSAPASFCPVPYPSLSACSCMYKRLPLTSDHFSPQHSPIRRPVSSRKSIWSPALDACFW